MRRINKNKQSGFSLVEAMVAMVAGLLVGMAVTAFSLSMIRSHTETVQSTRVLQDLRITADLMVRELQRSGFDRDAIRLVANQENYINGFSQITYGPAVAAPAATCPAIAAAESLSSCILFSYDRAGINDDAGAPDGEEMKGFRLVPSADESRGIVQMFIGSADDEPACDDASDAAGWQNITPPGVDVVGLFVADNSAEPMDLASIPGAQVEVRTVSLQVSAIPSGVPGGRQRMVCDDVRVRADAVSF